MNNPAALRSVDQLAAALASGTLPRGVRDMGERVMERLTGPVRIVVLGSPDAGLPGVVNGLVGGPELPEGPGMPPMELHFGMSDVVNIVTCDGQATEIDRAGFARLDPWRLAMATFSAPLPMLERVSFLVVPLEGAATEIDAAVNWAARKADMAIWAALETPERHRPLWRRLPESLLDHAYLVVTGPAANSAGPGIGDDLFRSVHVLGSGSERGAMFDLFRDELLSHVAMARREDLEGALVFLDRYKPDTAPIRPSPPEDPPDFSELLDPPPPRDIAPGEPQNHRPTAEIVTFLAAQANTLSELCGPSELSEADILHAATVPVLAHCAESIEACNEMAAEIPGELADILTEAADLILLMQIEATPQAMGDAIALMVQLRHDCEARLCA